MDFDLDRRAFLKVMGSVGLASLVGCAREPVKRLVSHVTPQQEYIPGVVNWYASVCRECPAGCGIVVASMGGRPIKIEGNPLHPVNRGVLCARGQAALQGLYNPDRVREPLVKAENGKFGSIGWEKALARIAEEVRGLKEKGSLDRAAVVFPHLSGTMARLIDIWSRDLPGFGIYEYEPISYKSMVAANEICFGRGLLPLYRFNEADLVVSFGADFLETWISPMTYARDFSMMRSYREGILGKMVVVSPRQSLTAANADEMVLIRPGTYGAFALGVLKILEEDGLRPPSTTIDRDSLRHLVGPYDPKNVTRLTGVAEDRLRSVARLIAVSRRSLILPGSAESSGSNSTRNNVAVNVLNYYLGNYGKTIDLPDHGPVSLSGRRGSVSELIERMRSGRIDLLIVDGVNPVYSLPPSAGFLGGLGEVKTVVSCDETLTETTSASGYILPIHHSLESWDDYEPSDMVRGLLQPMIRPLGDSKHTGDLLIEISRRSVGEHSGLAKYKSYYNFLMDSWKEIARKHDETGGFRKFWEDVLRRGGLFGELKSSPVILSDKAFTIEWEGPRIESSGTLGSEPRPGSEFEGNEATLMVYPSLARYDGRGANRPWLQELQDPMLQNVWSTCIEVSKDKSRKMGLKKGDVLSVSSPYGAVKGPVYISNQALEETVAIAMGQGHRAYGRFADGTGVNPMELLPLAVDDLSGESAYLCVKVQLKKTEERVEVPTPEGTPFDKGRGIAQTIDIAELRDMTTKRQGEPAHEERKFKELLSPYKHPDYRWGMVIDLNACIGCGACVVACYAENNIYVIGPEQYKKGREMAWVRVERYYNHERPSEVRFIPVPCQQCEDAPCEPVCPVYATYHTHEGLNAQIYNRCVGTRYCANNCPYAVRRFNWFSYHFTKPLDLQLNPNVTVRNKGVMEKCTFCIQRIVAAKDRAKDEDRKVKDGEVIPACAQTCPTRAITFGNLKDPDSEVSRKSRSARGYKVLEYINTKPAITYLKKIIYGEDLV